MQAERDVLSVIPGRANDLARLRVLAQGGEPIVTVIGKYNHGKSRLLNELVEQDAFAVADKRQTVALSDFVHKGVRWLDAPGLDADVGTEDDRHALQAAWLKSDIRLFVHAAKEGELDAKESAMLAELRADGVRTQRQTLFVLSQVDQLADDAEQEKVVKTIHAQVPGITLHAISATRHRQGVEGGKKLLVEKSGIPALRKLLDEALARVPGARAHETSLLFGEIRQELQQLRAEQEKTLEALRQKQTRQQQDFDQGLKAVLAKVGVDLEEVIDMPGPDHAGTPDTAGDMYKVTAAKLERARIQVAYSRASIEIEGFLAGHGVIGLPAVQETGARSLDTVMVAVLGVFVKFRKDIRRMFCEAAGQERLRQDFTHYFELSADRVSLAKQLTDTESAIAASEQALAALRTLEARA